MVTQPAYDTDFAVTVAQIMRTQLSTYSQTQDRLFGAVNIIPLTYGNTSIYRPIADPDQKVIASRTFQGAPTDLAEKIVQHLDLVNLSDRLSIPRVDFAGDAANAAQHISAHSSILMDGLEKLFIEGLSTTVLSYGVYDYPSGTTGTVNRPEVAHEDATDGDWSTTANIRSDLIKCIIGLTTKKFYGPYLMLAPSAVRPMFSDVLANTSVSTSTWIKNNFGLDIAYSPFVHEAATSDDFNVIIIDRSKVHMGMTQILMDSFYNEDKHAFTYDWEVYASPLFDPLFDNTEYLKGVARMDARDWAD